MCLEWAQANPSALRVPYKIPSHFTERRVYFQFWTFHFWHYQLAEKHIFFVFFQLHNCLRADSQLLCWHIFLRSPSVIKELWTIQVSTGFLARNITEMLTFNFSLKKIKQFFGPTPNQSTLGQVLAFVQLFGGRWGEGESCVVSRKNHCSRKCLLNVGNARLIFLDSHLWFW